MKLEHVGEARERQRIVRYMQDHAPTGHVESNGIMSFLSWTIDGETYLWGFFDWYEADFPPDNCHDIYLGLVVVPSPDTAPEAANEV